MKILKKDIYRIRKYMLISFDNGEDLDYNDLDTSKLLKLNNNFNKIYYDSFAILFLKYYFMNNLYCIFLLYFYFLL